MPKTEPIVLSVVIWLAHQKIKTTKRVRKTGGNYGYKKCPNCGGDGRVKVRKKKG